MIDAGPVDAGRLSFSHGVSTGGDHEEFATQRTQNYFLLALAADLGMKSWRGRPPNLVRVVEEYRNLALLDLEREIATGSSCWKQALNGTLHKQLFGIE